MHSSRVLPMKGMPHETESLELLRSWNINATETKTMYMCQSWSPHRFLLQMETYEGGKP